MPPGQSGVLRLFGVGCQVAFVQLTVEANAIDLLATETFTLDIPLPDIDIYSNLSGFAANTPLAHFVTSMANKKQEELLEALLSAQADHEYRFEIAINANNIPVLRLYAEAGIAAGLTIDFDHTWDIWITNCNPFFELAEAPA